MKKIKYIKVGSFYGSDLLIKESDCMDYEGWDWAKEFNDYIDSLKMLKTHKHKAEITFDKKKR